MDEHVARLIRGRQHCALGAEGDREHPSGVPAELVSGLPGSGVPNENVSVIGRGRDVPALRIERDIGDGPLVTAELDGLRRSEVGQRHGSIEAGHREPIGVRAELDLIDHAAVRRESRQPVRSVSLEQQHLPALIAHRDFACIWA